MHFDEIKDQVKLGGKRHENQIKAVEDQKKKKVETEDPLAEQSSQKNM